MWHFKYVCYGLEIFVDSGVSIYDLFKGFEFEPRGISPGHSSLFSKKGLKKNCGEVNHSNMVVFRIESWCEEGRDGSMGRWCL